MVPVHGYGQGRGAPASCWHGAVQVGRIANPTHTRVQLVHLAASGLDLALALGARRAVPLLTGLLHYGDFFVRQVVQLVDQAVGGVDLALKHGLGRGRLGCGHLLVQGQALGGRGPSFGFTQLGCAHIHLASTAMHVRKVHAPYASRLVLGAEMIYLMSLQ